MSESPSDLIPSNAQQRLLDAALELFSRKGYAAASVRELVEAAGVTKPVLYYYFRNKAGLYLALIQSGLSEFRQTAEKAKTSPGTAVQRINAYCICIFDLFVARLPVARLIYAIYYGPPQGAPPVDFEASFTTMLEDIDELLAQGMAGGELPQLDRGTAAWAVVSILNTAMEEQLCRGRQPRLDRVGLEQMLQLLFKGIVR